MARANGGGVKTVSLSTSEAMWFDRGRISRQRGWKKAGAKLKCTSIDEVCQQKPQSPHAMCRLAGHAGKTGANFLCRENETPRGAKPNLALVGGARGDEEERKSAMSFDPGALAFAWARPPHKL